MVLSGWKAIANYLKGGTRTVQRWEKEAGLPVLRPRPGPRGHVIAYSEQLDRWLKYSNGHRPDIPKIESEIHRTQQLLLRLSEERRNMRLRLDGLRHQLALLRTEHRRSWRDPRRAIPA